MSVTWTLKDASGANLTHQPASGSPLALQYDTNGYTHLSGYASEIIYSCEAEADTSSVTITLSPDTSGDTLSESLSSPTKDPTTHGGSLTWTNLSGGSDDPGLHGAVEHRDGVGLGLPRGARDRAEVEVQAQARRSVATRGPPTRATVRPSGCRRPRLTHTPVALQAPSGPRP